MLGWHIDFDSLPLPCIRLTMNFASIDDVTGRFIAPPATCPCHNLTFECTVPAFNESEPGGTFWRLDGGNSSCTLLHEDTSVNSICDPFIAMFTNTTNSSFLTSLNGTAKPAMDGTLVECIGPEHGSIVGNSTIQIVG